VDVAKYALTALTASFATSANDRPATWRVKSSCSWGIPLRPPRMMACTAPSLKAQEAGRLPAEDEHAQTLALDSRDAATQGHPPERSRVGEVTELLSDRHHLMLRASTGDRRLERRPAGSPVAQGTSRAARVGSADDARSRRIRDVLLLAHREHSR
jgi:hypothetical protein